MKPFIYLSIVIGSILVGGCKAKNVPLEENFETKRLKGKEISITNGFFANPYDIEIVDTIMLLLDNDKYFTAIDIKNKCAINRFGIEGRGPNELAYPADLVYNKQERLVSFRLRNPTRNWSLNFDDLKKPDIIFNEKVNLNFDLKAARVFGLVPI